MSAKRSDSNQPGSEYEEMFAILIRHEGLPEPKRQYKFFPSRNWKTDFAWVDQKIIAEVEGGVWTNGRHTRGQGFINDCIKYNTATLLGWKVYRFTSDMIQDGTAVETIKKAIGEIV